MPIALLPDATTRAICSSLVLNDACSVVKELVDNALDASATTIVIETSSDALDVIQIKDNGRGIGVEDRQLVCKRGCTSKIRSMEDLEQLGGSSLGFRGEALASVAELSQAVVVTTRIDGEVVGTSLNFGRDGTLLSSSSASHPVGTTFRVEGFLQALPVRRQTAKKAAPKTLAAIKKLLHGYAFARPSVRIIFKILKAKSEKGNWTYGPKIGSSSLQDAVSKIVGQEVATHCELKSTSSQQNLSEEGNENGYSIEAILAKTDADMSKIHNVGHFVSVDGRPINPGRGTAKDIIKLYKAYCRAAATIENAASTADPFLCMHLSCPPESYDVNVEPAKDEVLFSNSPQVMSLVDNLFSQYYGGLKSSARAELKSPIKDNPRRTTSGNFDLLLARAPSLTARQAAATLPPPPKPMSVSGDTLSRLADEDSARHVKSPDRPDEHMPEQRVSRRLPVTNSCHVSVDENVRQEVSQPHFNMYDIDDEDLPDLGAPSLSQGPDVDECDEDEVRSAHVTNPWSLAKLHAPVGRDVFLPPGPGAVSQPMTPESGLRDSMTTRHAVTHDGTRSHQARLPSPATSSPSPFGYQNPGPPQRRKAYAINDEHDDDDIQFTQEPASKSSEPLHTNTLDSWARPRHASVQFPGFLKASDIYNRDGRFGPTARTVSRQVEGFVESSPSSQLIEVDQRPAEYRTHSINLKKPFRSPFNVTGHTESQHEKDLVGPDTTKRHTDLTPTPFFLPRQESVPSQQLPSPSGPNSNGCQMPPQAPLLQHSFKASQSINPELTDILEFEHRKQAVVTQQRKSQSKNALRERNPARLAQIQQQSNDFLPSSQTRRSLPGLNLREEESNPACDFGRRSGPSANDELSQSAERNSPHKNRYMAAKQRLAHATPHGNDQPRKTRGDGQDAASMPAQSDTDETILSRFSEDDPRAYLMRHRADVAQSNGGTGLTKTGLKIRRIKTARFPLETIAVETALHGIRATSGAPFPAVDVLAVLCSCQNLTDAYVASGKDDFGIRSANNEDIQSWEVTMNELISATYRAELVDGEVVVPEISWSLTDAIKTHTDALDL